MSRKAFLVQVELDVQAITCPGVWLCSNGKVSLQIYMLDSCIQTESYKPNFPIQCREKFVFYKTFYTKHQLVELQKELHDQWLFMELVQWQNCEIGNVLASFQITLDELLFPSTFNGSIAGVDLDLLMEPSKTFPGTIAPKIEISTKTTIEETLCVCTKPSSSTVIVNPKVIMSTEHRRRGPVRRKVCHSVDYSRWRKPTKIKPTSCKPLWSYKRPEPDLIMRKPTYEPPEREAYCRRKNMERKNLSILTMRRRQQMECPCAEIRMCPCGSGHRENLCSVCAKYQGYFSNTQVACPPPMQSPPKVQPSSQPRTSLFNENKKCFTHAPSQHCPCCRPSVYATVEEKDEADDSDPNLCFCSNKPSLAQRLHQRLSKTLASIPGSIDCSCYEDEYECNCCDYDRTSRGELYRDLQKFYGDLYEKARYGAVCAPGCGRLK